MQEAPPHPCLLLPVTQPPCQHVLPEPQPISFGSISHGTLYLASPAAVMVTGHTLLVDRGGSLVDYQDPGAEDAGSAEASTLIVRGASPVDRPT